ncbi:MAG: hypothetical protein LW636_00320 [Planctomycetaceae bacterium]|nr:hypothetical protein [Planctomycetaceae bacterium]
MSAAARADRVQAVRRFVARRWLALSVAAGALAVGAVGYLMGEGRFGAEREAALKEIDTYVAVLTKARSDRENRPKMDARLQAVADRTLGSSVESVDSEFRRRLNRMCEELGLSEFSVTTGVSMGRATPAKREFSRPSERSLRDEPDFFEVQGTVSASGGVDQLLGLVFRVDADPWLKRMESIRLDPNTDGTKVRMTLKVSTLFMPGRNASKPLVLDPKALAAANRYSVLFAANPFRIPEAQVVTVPTAPVAPSSTPPQPPAAAPSANTAAPPAPNPGFPYGEWLVTGVIEGPAGPEAWLRHVPTGSQLTLTPGVAVGELVFRSVRYDFAEFDAPAGSCRIQIGNNLTQRIGGAG